MNRRKLLTGAAALGAFAGPGKEGWAQGTPITSAIPYNQLQILARPSLIRTRRPNGGNLGAQASTSITFHVTWALDGPITAYRPIFENDTISTYAIANHTYAETADENIANFRTPRDGGGTTIAWKNATFNGAGADQRPDQNPGGSTFALTIAAAASTAVKAYSFGDWMNVNSIPPLDGSNNYLLFTRVFVSAAGRGAFAGSSFSANWDYNGSPNEALNKLVVPRAVAGSHFNDNTVFNNTSSDSGWIIPGAIQYMSPNLGHTVMCLGDSLTQGFGTIGTLNCWGHKACATISTPTRPVVFSNAGWTGQTTAQIQTRAFLDLPVIRPTVCFIETFSPNDGLSTTALVNAQLTRAMNIASYCQSLGIVPIFKTGIPWGTFATADDAARMVGVNIVKSWGANAEYLVWDENAIVTDGATPQRVQAQYQYTDLSHLNDLGHLAAGVTGGALGPGASAAAVLARALA